MRIALSINAAGDIRLQHLRDKKAPPKPAVLSAPSLVCSSEFQERIYSKKGKQTCGYGVVSMRNRFTRYARTRIREAGGILDRHNRQHCSFLTATLPGSTEGSYQALAAWSGWLVSRVSQWIRDTTPHALFCGVWEYQKRGALHLHLCIAASSAREALRLRMQWKTRWIALLRRVCKLSGVDLFARHSGGSWEDSPWVTRTDAQVVEKSVGNYLAKYLSKGSAKTRRRCYYPPSAWSFVSRELLLCLRESRRKAEVTSLSCSCALDLFERLGAVVAEQVHSAFGYIGKFDVRQKGLIALAKPIQASMMFDYIVGALRLLGVGERVKDRAGNTTLSDWIIAFSAQPIFGDSS